MTILATFLVFFAQLFQTQAVAGSVALTLESKSTYWFLLQRQSNREYLFFGVPGNKRHSTVIRQFIVKTGIPGKRPTPLPQLLGRDYWIMTNKSSSTNPEAAPYFLTLDIPWSMDPPYGPIGYLECGGQCNWQIPGEFGLHGVGGDETKLATNNEGSSGCIRHSDADIAYLYDLLEPKETEIRYYVENR